MEAQWCRVWASGYRLYGRSQERWYLVGGGLKSFLRQVVCEEPLLLENPGKNAKKTERARYSEDESRARADPRYSWLCRSRATRASFFQRIFEQNRDCSQSFRQETLRRTSSLCTLQHINGYSEYSVKYLKMSDLCNVALSSSILLTQRHMFTLLQLS